LHYSVSEAQGTIDINVIKKQKSTEEVKVGVRTKDGEALAGEDYVAIDEPVVFGKNQTFAKVSIKIIDDDGWEPDENFYVELYDLATGKKLEGADAETKITIIDDDKPGNLQFASRLVPALVTNDKVVVEVSLEKTETTA